MKNENKKWIITVFILTFILSVLFSATSNLIAESFNNVVLLIILLITIGIGILLDVVGTGTISAREATFHSLSSKRVHGARTAVFMIKNSSKVSSICNDIVGDICGIISGSIGTMLAISISTTYGFNNTIVSIILAAFISSMTVGGKAIFKQIAIKNANKIVLRAAKIVSFFGGEK